MILVETIFDEAFDGLKIPENDNLFFHYGDQKELDTILTMRDQNGQKNYPLMWYLMPNKVDVSEGVATGTFNFIFAHNTELDWLNDQRFEKVFKDILSPCVDAVLECIERSSNIATIDGNHSFINYPNYGNPTTFEGNEEAKQLNYWDAIRLEIGLNIYKNYEC